MDRGDGTKLFVPLSYNQHLMSLFNLLIDII
jgi:hypothetical protein